MAQTATKKVPARSGSGGKTLPPLRVRYYRRMRLGRAYPIHICWEQGERGVAGKEITLRLNMAGVFVTPAEQTMKPTDPDDEVTFYATPLAKGKLQGSQLDVWYQGAKVQEMPLPCRVTTQFASWMFLLLTILVPSLLLYFCKYHPYRVGTMSPELSMEKLLFENLPDKALMNDTLPGYEEWVDTVDDWLAYCVKGVAHFYGQLVLFCQQYPLAWMTKVVLFLLTLYSFWSHRAKRKRRLGEPIFVPSAAME